MARKIVIVCAIRATPGEVKRDYIEPFLKPRTQQAPGILIGAEAMGEDGDCFMYTAAPPPQFFKPIHDVPDPSVKYLKSLSADYTGGPPDCSPVGLSNQEVDTIMSVRHDRVMFENASIARHPLVALIDETIRLNSRLRSVFAQSRHYSELNESEHMVLNAVVEAERIDRRAPTVAQIGRSMGQARQLVQRAANSLRDAGLIESVENPDHKRAPLFRPTAAGVALKREIDLQADAIAEELLPELDAEVIRAVAAALRDVRKQIEMGLRHPPAR